MAQAITISTGETGTTRVFSLSMPAAEAQHLRDDEAAQRAVLGLDSLNPDGIEVFALRDLGDLGLIGYLREGVDVPEADLKRDAARLAALDGWVMLVHSLAFGGQSTTLKPSSTLTLIGTYGQTKAKGTPVPLEAQSAAPYSGTPKNTARPAAPRFRNPVVAGGVLIVLIVLILIWVMR